MLGGALNAGVRPGEVKEIVYQAVPYVGILRIATNYCLNAARDRRRGPEPRDELPDLPVDVSLEQVLSDRDMVRRIVGRVDEKLRAAAWAHYVDGLDHVEAARMLGISRRTVANRLAVFEERARKIIRRTS